MRNTQRELPWSIKEEILSEFSHKLMCSGYSERIRYEIISAAVVGYERQCDRADRGITPLHRPRSFDRPARVRKKLMTKTSWYRPADAVGFFPATPKGELAQRIQKIVSEEAARLNLRVKVIEQGGVSLKQQLVRTDLTQCFWPECYLCEGGEKGGSHTRRGAVYIGTCTLCQDQFTVSNYYGESSFSGYHRASEHKKAILGGDESNAFTKHLLQFHPDRAGDPSVFKLRVVGNRRKCLERQASEAVKIAYSDHDNLLNSKSEFHQAKTNRVTVQRGLGS